MQPVNARPRVTSNQPTKRIIVVKNSEKDKKPCPQDISYVSNNEYTRPVAITPPISYTEQTTLSQVRPVVYLQETQTVPYRPTFLSPDRVFTTSSSVPVSSANLDTSSIPLNTAQYYFVSERFQSPQPPVPVSSANQFKTIVGSLIDTQRMSYTEHGSRSTYYVRILRVTYTKCSEINALPPPLHLNCKTIIPYQVAHAAFSEEYEDMRTVKERLTRWVVLTGARVLSAETAAMRLRTGKEARHGIETTYTYNRSEINEHWIYVFRLYLDGYYADPPAHLMPQPPTPVYDDCCVIL
ncbi:uncharacterized protein LOC111632968 [Centruroides sculpturatus]|uniref:uncharacterized protein LOC111632968 n=1 Tax=Centruroides sculpturatus TaxID=218467 RepID=UPI000C6CC982|nr:uncharacterized protein LOC111632968 [Centruroides sculpturatus]